MPQWIVDAFNVLGARPDGWWRDRPGALVRLLDEIIRWRDETGESVIVMIDGRPDPLGPPPGRWYGVDTRYTGRSDRDAADDAIVELLAGDLADVADEVIVATSDRELTRRARALGADVEGAAAFRRRLDAIGSRRDDRAVLAAFGIDESALLGRGGEARVFALDADRVLRLPHQGGDHDLAARRAFLDTLTAERVPFAVPTVLEHREVAGRTVVIERRLPGRSALVELTRPATDRAALIRSHLDAAAAISHLAEPRIGWGERWGAAADEPRSFAEWSRRRVSDSLRSAGPDVARLDADALTDDLVVALADAGTTAHLVHLDGYLGNMLAAEDRITAVLDFGPTTIGGPAGLDPLTAIAYLTPEISPGVTEADRAIAHGWAIEHGLDHALEPAERWAAAFWAWARDDERLHHWCRRVLGVDG